MITFLIGFLAGLVSMFCFVIGLGLKSLKKKEVSSTEEKAKPAPKATSKSVRDRMSRVKAITTEQLELSQQADGPQKNGLHGKSKNDIIGQIKKLDEERNQILTSIISDGHDPELTTIDESGVVSEMKLSEYMAYMGIKMPPKDQVKTKQLGKYTLIKGGKTDGDSGTTH